MVPTPTEHQTARLAGATEGPAGRLRLLAAPRPKPGEVAPRLARQVLALAR